MKMLCLRAWFGLLMFSLASCVSLSPIRSVDLPLAPVRAWFEGQTGPLVVHQVDWPELPVRFFLARVDLSNPELELFTDAEPANQFFPLVKTSQFLRQTGADLAINLSLYSRPADGQAGVGQPLGWRYTEGQWRGRPWSTGAFLAVGPGQRVRILATPDPQTGPDFSWGATGYHHLLQAGRVLPQPVDYHPRTGLGLSGDGHWLWILVADGRQWQSRGLAVPELAAIFLALGCSDALNLDGGGSSVLVVRDAEGRPVVVNSPHDDPLWGGERAVANHLGLRIGKTPATR